MDDAPKAKGLVELVKETATKTFVGLGRGLDAGLDASGHALEGAGRALAAPEATELAPLMGAADLPSIVAVDRPLGPLSALSERLDREADLFRGIALRELARVGWVERVTQSVVVAAAVCEGVIAACASAAALFATPIEGRTGLFFVAALIVAIGAATVIYAAARVRGSHARLAEQALARAKEIEARMFRVALALEWRGAGDALFQDALARLERDVVTPERDVAAVSG